MDEKSTVKDGPTYVRTYNVDYWSESVPKIIRTEYYQIPIFHQIVVDGSIVDLNIHTYLFWLLS